MNIVLIGYRGSGKSTVAQLLASDLNMPHVCLDQEIVKRAGKTIPEIVSDHGWEYFRDMESDVVKDFSEKQGWIVDAGGGVILRDNNVRLLRRNGLLVWLKAQTPVLIERMQGDTQRPSLKEGKTFLEEVEEVLREREPLYRTAAHREIDNTDLTPEEVSLKIQDIVLNHRDT